MSPHVPSDVHACSLTIIIPQETKKTTSFQNHNGNQYSTSPKQIISYQAHFTSTRAHTSTLTPTITQSHTHTHGREKREQAATKFPYSLLYLKERRGEKRLLLLGLGLQEALDDLLLLNEESAHDAAEEGRTEKGGWDR